MARRKNPLSRIKIVFRPGNPAVKIALLVVVVASIAALIMINAANKQRLAEQERIRQQIAQQEKDKQKYEQGIENAGTQDGLEDYAENELDLVPGDNTIFVGDTTP